MPEMCTEWLIVWCLTPFSTVFQLYHGGQYTYPCFSWSSFHNILSKPLASFPHNHCRNNGQRWKRNDSCRNDYHQSSERILAEPGIEPATSCSQVYNAIDWTMGLGPQTCKFQVRQANFKFQTYPMQGSKFPYIYCKMQVKIRECELNF